MGSMYKKRMNKWGDVGLGLDFQHEPPLTWHRIDTWPAALTELHVRTVFHGTLNPNI